MVAATAVGLLLEGLALMAEELGVPIQQQPLLGQTTLAAEAVAEVIPLAQNPVQTADPVSSSSATPTPTQSPTPAAA